MAGVRTMQSAQGNAPSSLGNKAIEHRLLFFVHCDTDHGIANWYSCGRIDLLQPRLGNIFQTQRPRCDKAAAYLMSRGNIYRSRGPYISCVGHIDNDLQLLTGTPFSLLRVQGTVNPLETRFPTPVFLNIASEYFWR